MKKIAAKGKRCVLCDAAVSPDFRPFCSRRCADIDLQRWFSGAYALPVEEDDSTPEADEANPRS